MLVSALWHRIGQQARVNLGEKCKTYFKTTREGKVKAKAKIGNDFKDIGLLQTSQGEWVGHGQSGFRSISHGTSNPNCLTWCPGCRCRRSCESWGCSLQFKVPFCSKCYMVPRSVLFSTQAVRRTLSLTSCQSSLRCSSGNTLCLTGRWPCGCPLQPEGLSLFFRIFRCSWRHCGSYARVRRARPLPEHSNFTFVELLRISKNSSPHLVIDHMSEAPTK